ncbi:MAG: endolytic transglycosylase MltG [Ruminococcaceae bacterium]|nr:endolytic transglycosylase MltG [Oscillospiraceae bacterium]
MDNENKYSDWENQEETGEFDKTQEMNSVPLSSVSDDEIRGITPREEFIENNSAENMEKTMRMDSLRNGVPTPNRPSSANPVKKRRKKKKQTNHTRTMGQIFLGSVISVGAIGIGVALAINVIGGIRDFTGMSKPSNKIEITISDTMTPSSIAETLHSSGVIESPWLFKTYLKISKNEDSFREGIHIVSSNMSYGSIINALATQMSYNTETVDVVIPEGLTANEIGKILEDNMVCRAADFVKCYKDKINEYDFEEGIPNNPNRFYALEGYIFPDTYQFYVNEDLKRNPNFDTSEYALKIVDKMYDNFENKITKDMKKRMAELDMTLDEVITLASLIEWEGTNEENMANISSVFHNRLNDPENFAELQSDTTDTYIKRVIEPNTKSLSADKRQEIEDAYDTYKCEGLPPGPICNPGMMAIKAALYPAQTNYYYFLASSDGVFYWARTLEEHEQNIKDAALHAEEEE